MNSENSEIEETNPLSNTHINDITSSTSASRSNEEIKHRLEQTLAARLQQLPGIDTEEFLDRVKNPKSGETLSSEVLCWAIGKFLQQNQEEKAVRVYTVLHLRSENLARTLARNQTKWLANQLPGDKYSSIIEDIVTKTLLHMYNQIRQGKEGYSLNFNSTLSLTIRGMVSDFLRKEGYVERKRSSEISVTNNESPKPRRQPTVSLSATLESDGELALEDKLEDPQNQYEFDRIELVNLLSLLIPRLTQEEIQILKLRLEGYSINEIATELHKDWKWIARKLYTIGRTAYDLKIIEPTPEQLNSLGGKRWRKGLQNGQR